MHLKKIIVSGAATALLAGSLLNVSAAEIPAGSYAKALKDNENLIINVDAYKAAYSDLAKAFGDDEDAYIEHYLTKGVFEGRTKGVLFDPLAYAEAYGDVKAAFGDNILAIVNHYVTFGVTENRTMGTANGYEDIAEAEENGALGVVVQRNNIAVTGYAPNNSNGTSLTTGSYPTAVSNYTVAGQTDANNTGTALTETTAGGSSTTPVTNNRPTYGHTTSIYTNDESTLLRVEYYNDDNKLVEYSTVTNYDKTTQSYTETVYKYDNETNTQITVRTDTYVNGQLTSSQNY